MSPLTEGDFSPQVCGIPTQDLGEAGWAPFAPGPGRAQPKASPLTAASGTKSRNWSALKSSSEGPSLLWVALGFSSTAKVLSELCDASPAAAATFCGQVTTSGSHPEGWSPWSLFLVEPAEPPAGWQEPLPGRHPMISARPQGWDGRPPPGASGGDGQGQNGGCLPRACAPHPAWHPRRSLPAPS